MTSLSVKAVYDYLVIGAGSGGVASARRASKLGAKCGIIESNKLGGTCVNAGCVPKKIMYNAATIAETLHTSRDCCYKSIQSIPEFEWTDVKRSRDAHIANLNNVYAKLLEKDKVDVIKGKAKFVDPHRVEVNGEIYEGKHILIATGGYPIYPDIPGAEYGITSDGFFELEHLPKRVLVVGSGYIAVELAAIFSICGAETMILMRRDNVLSKFDESIGEMATKNLEEMGIKLFRRSAASKLEKHNGKLKCFVTNFDFQKPSSPEHFDFVIENLDCVLWAIGRTPRVSDLNLSAANVQLAEGNRVMTDDYQVTSVPHIYAVGDVTNLQIELTPVAIAAGRCLSDRLFNPSCKGKKLDCSVVPSVIFSHPPIGSVGLSQKSAEETFGKDNIKVYKSVFTNLYYALSNKKQKTLVKLIVQGPNEKIVGLHIVGMGADEMLQGFAVAIRMGATKSDFDKTIAIHPTAAEEVVTLT